MSFDWAKATALRPAIATFALAISTAGAAQSDVPPPEPRTLHEAVEIAVRLSPEAASLPALNEQASALNRAGRGLFSGPPVVAGDALIRGSGSIEQEASVSVGLRWPGERKAIRAWADSTGEAANSGFAAARLRIAGEVRAAWWALANARAMAVVDRDQAKIAKIAAGQVSRLVDAGEESRRNLLLAQAEAFAAASRLGQAQAEQAQAEATFAALAGQAPNELPPEAVAAPGDIDANPALRAAIARATATDARARSLRYDARGRVEAQAGARRERVGPGQGSATSLLLGLRVPLGRNQIGVADAAAARAEALTAAAEVLRLRGRLRAEQAAAQYRLEFAKNALLDAEARRSALAQSFALTEKGRREGEIGFIEALRARQSLSEAERDLATAQIASAAAISAFNQAMGIVP